MPGVCLQLRQECASAQQRADAAEAQLEQERSAHRRDLRRKNKDLAEAQVGPSRASNSNTAARLNVKTFAGKMQ
jgi:hypothetical protein